MRLFENSFKHASIALVIGLSLFTTGCSSLASKKVTDNTVVFDEEQSLYYSAPELSSEKPPVTYRPIEADTLNALLTAEIAGHRKRDRKSTRLNSSHVRISYAVFCLKKKKKNK